MTRFDDGSAGDTNYGSIGRGYAAVRRPDPRIEAVVEESLGDARSVINVGAGAGSYEPRDRIVVAVEPSASMRAERPRDRVPAIDGTADHLPFDDGAFDAAMASVTVHQWPDLERGLGELRRVSRGPVAILTFDPIVPEPWWQPVYVPELYEVEARRMPPLSRIADALGGTVEIRTVMIPADCIDGFGQAFFARPEETLRPEVRRAMSAWSFLDPGVVERYERELGADLRSGAWDERWGAFRDLRAFDGGLRLVVSRP
ncbi:class I SAM-dependent methyltransferase [Pseudolysinimonas sp.]|uniref:class I SAM-dependent methyltransferase n=1 Tax=Pseudolysinimonas sp. TaxID=2680009 RepID=UPI003F80E4F1